MPDLRCRARPQLIHGPADHSSTSLDCTLECQPRLIDLAWIFSSVPVADLGRGLGCQPISVSYRAQDTIGTALSKQADDSACRI